MTLSRDDLLRARERIAHAVSETPLQRSERLSSLHGTDVFLKREDLHPVRSYKLRGALNYILASIEKNPNVLNVPVPIVTASAGNHAQGVAWACRELQIRGVIVIPTRTPRQKYEAIARIGGDFVSIIRHGATYDDAEQRALEILLQEGALFVPPFNSELTIAGQGTVGLELESQLSNLGVPSASVVAPCGGGGLAAGLALALAHTQHELIVVEPKGCASLTAAIAAGEPVPLGDIDTFVDGAAVRRVGTEPFAVLTQHPPAGVLTIDEGAVATAMLELFQADGIITEPAGALSLAALRDVAPSQPVVCVVSGSNTDVSRYNEVIERSLVHRGLKHYFLVEFDQSPGALRRFLDEVLGPSDDITLFEYTKKSNRETGPALVGVELQHREDLQGLLERLSVSPLRFERIEPGSPLQRFLV